VSAQHLPGPALWQLLAVMLWRLPKPDFILLQTPPCIPSFTVCRLTAWWRGAKFIIDWHNFAYTLMAGRYKLKLVLTAPGVSA
jgi:hypothetical protein